MLAAAGILLPYASGRMLFGQSKDTSIDWKEAEAKDFSSNEELKNRPIYNDWEKPKGITSKPLLFYFYWPVEDKTSADKDTKSQAEKTEKMDRILASDGIREESAPFACIKVNLRVLKQWGSKGEALSAKYGVRRAPALAFFDRTGFPQGHIVDSTNEATLGEKMSFVASIGSSGSGGDWTSADALDYKDEKHLKKRKVFEDWLQARELGEAKPMIFFFYWPTSDKKDKDASKNAKAQAEKTEEMEKVLRDGDVSKQLARFYCFKVNMKELKSYEEYGAAYMKKYKVKSAPVLILFDYKGTKLISITGKQKSASLARKLKSAADKSDKTLKK